MRLQGWIMIDCGWRIMMRHHIFPDPLQSTMVIPHLSPDPHSLPDPHGLTHSNRES